MKASDAGSKVRIARVFVRIIDDTVNFAVLVVLLLLLLFGCYSLWDSEQVYAAASPAQYEIYKPGDGNSLPLEELMEKNPDVLGWITVYGTGIDYPLVQGEDNWEYLDKAADGSYNMTGSIFLDSKNKRDFSDYNTIIHGHNMAESAMFGDISDYNDRKFFDEHIYGNLYANGRDYGIVFFGYLTEDAYDSDIYASPYGSPETQQEYLSLLESRAIHLRQSRQHEAEHIVLLSTCGSGSTNARDLLVGYLTEETYPDIFYAEKEQDVKSIDRLAQWYEFRTLPLWLSLMLLLIALILMLICFDRVSRSIRIKKAKKMYSTEKEGNEHD